jgi:hypothetical protein
VLHRTCNALLGLAADSPECLERAAKYLLDHTAIRSTLATG